MNQREALLILFESTADLPETRHLRRARRWATKRLEVLRVRYARMHETRMLHRFYQHLPNCAECGSGVRHDKYCAVGQQLVDDYLAAKASV